MPGCGERQQNASSLRAPASFDLMLVHYLFHLALEIYIAQQRIAGGPPALPSDAVANLG
jgi:hypothetical protein